MSSNPYHKMTIAQKQAHAMSTAREPSVMCPACDTHCMPEDLLQHMDVRCSGPREPGPGAKWVNWREALALGVNGTQLTRWAQRGHVRVSGEYLDRRYLLRDLAMRISQKRGFHRR